MGCTSSSPSAALSAPILPALSAADSAGGVAPTSPSRAAAAAAAVVFVPPNDARSDNKVQSLPPQSAPEGSERIPPPAHAVRAADSQAEARAPPGDEERTNRPHADPSRSVQLPPGAARPLFIPAFPGPFRLISLESLQKCAQLPRHPHPSVFDSHSAHDVDLRMFDRPNSLLVYVSHNWQYDAAAGGGEGLLQLLCAGARRVWQDFAPSRACCYLWLDYACTDMGAAERQHLHQIVAACDCMLTPLPDAAWAAGTDTRTHAEHEEYVESSEPALCEPASAAAVLRLFEHRWLSAYQARSFCSTAAEPIPAYLERAECRKDAQLCKTMPMLHPAAFSVEDLLAACTADANFCVQPGLRNAASWLLQGEAGSSSSSQTMLSTASATAVTMADTKSKSRAVVANLSYADCLQASAKRYFRLETARREAFRTSVRGALAPELELGLRLHWRPHFLFSSLELERKLPPKLLPTFDLERIAAGVGGPWADSSAAAAAKADAVGEGTAGAPAPHQYFYPDGGSFEGTFGEDGLRDGKGIYTWADGARYRGHYKCGRRHGMGLFESISFGYSGTWEEGARCGAGRCVTAHEVFEGEVRQGFYVAGVQTFANGDRYEGSFSCSAGNSKYGHGVFEWPSGDRYEGHWERDKQHGYGLYTYASGSCYAGMYAQGQMHGQGTYSTAAGDIYVGCFAQDLKHGLGKYTWASGDTYEGAYVSNLKHGQGTYSRSRGGEKYAGGWAQDKMSGQGQWDLSDGGSYVGAFANGLLHGFGIYKYPTGNVYEGHFCEGVMSGDGTLCYANGSIYSGNYTDGQRNGHGVYTRADGSSYEGDYVQDKMHGHGVYRWANGDTYTGQFKEDKRHGRGAKTYAAGGLKSGLWKDDEFAE